MTIACVADVATTSLFGTLNGLKKFHPDWQIDNGFLTGQSWRVLKSWYTCGGTEQGFRRCFAEGLDESLVPSVAQAKGDRYHVLLKSN